MFAVLELSSISQGADRPSLLREVDGVIRIGGTRVTLDTVVGAYVDGASAEEIALAYDSLELADIHETVAYYLRHRTEVEAYLARRESKAEEVRRLNQQRWPSAGIRERLLARKLKAT